jgi:hypothetical protein
MKTNHHNITEILLKVTLNSIKPTKPTNLYINYKKIKGKECIHVTKMYIGGKYTSSKYGRRLDL